mmetsp:Transcript_3448/g.3474  ORF Transcript_3448/g.3474 Transcript_3448/m.3474 type:complete len:346 (-) Transcript_3448:214-1251(-)
MDVTISDNMIEFGGHTIDLNHIELRKLRAALRNKWIANERFVSYLDMTGDGYIDYEEFYDLTNQFGLQKAISCDDVFQVMDVFNDGDIPLALFEKCLEPPVETVDPQAKSALNTSSSSLEEPYPTDLLVGLVAHNNMKPAMMQFVSDNIKFFCRVKLITTGSTGRSLSSMNLDVEQLVASGPLGGDQEIGGYITQGKIAAIFFFTDPLSAHPHSPDIEALNRICCVHDCMFANNPSTAKALVYSLQYFPFALSRLLGVNPSQNMDSSVVKAYKENQQKVIASVSAEKKKEDKKKKPSRRESTSSFAPERKGGRHKTNHRRQSKRQSMVGTDNLTDLLENFEGTSI